MKLKFVKPQEIDKNIKAAVHSNGKLGFSSEAAKKLELAENRGALIALNEETSDGNLYFKLQLEPDENCFTVMKAGEYFYINTKAFFESYEIEYKKVRIIYDIMDFTYEGEKMYKFLKREKKIKQIDKED
jgi:hypothetical protein